MSFDFSNESLLKRFENYTAKATEVLTPDITHGVICQIGESKYEVHIRFVTVNEEKQELTATRIRIPTHLPPTTLEEAVSEMLKALLVVGTGDVSNYFIFVDPNDKVTLNKINSSWYPVPKAGVVLGKMPESVKIVYTDDEG